MQCSCKIFHPEDGNKLCYSIVSLNGVTWLRAVRSGVLAPVGAGSFSHHCVQTGSEAPPSFLTNGYQGLFLWGQSGRGVKLTTHLHLVPRSRMRRAIPPLLQHTFMAWCSVKKSTGTTLPIPYTPEDWDMNLIHRENFTS
jgi:hypothetical protein